MPAGTPEWPDPAFYQDWKEWARETISRLNEELRGDYSEVGQTADFAVSLPENGRWLPANGGTFLNGSFPELAQKLGATFGAAPAGSTRLPTNVAPANHVAGIRAI